MEDLQEGRRFLLSAVMEAEIKSVLQKVPEKGVFPPVSWAMHYYGTGHEGRLYVQHSTEQGCAIRASIIPEGSSRELSNYVFFGSRQACLDWLKEARHVDVLMEIYDHLVEKADLGYRL